MNSKAKVAAEAQVGNDGDRRFTFTLNDDLSLEILLWLPAKSVFRFKSVCKHWLSIPSSADFCRIHTLNYPKQPKVRPSLLLKASDSNFFYFNPFMNVEKPLIPYTFSVPNPRVVSSCNGLMLLQSHHTEKSFHVYNPTNKQAREISVIDTQTDNEPFIVDLSLAFDPLESPHYKVVCIRSTTEAGADPNENHTYQIEVYDSESRTWSLKLGPFTFPQVLFINGDGVYWNGAIYWLIYNEIGYYDIGKNEFDTIALPTYSPIVSLGIVWTTTHSLQEANGRLYHSRLVTRGDWQAIELFELDTGDRSSWLLKYDETISDHKPTGSFHSHAHQLRFITEMCSVLSHMSGKISVHSFLNYSSKLLVELSDQPYYQEDCKMEMYEFGQCLALITIKGYAASGGGRGIERVDVSIDGGKTWVEASKSQKDGVPYISDGESSDKWAWVLFEAEADIPQSTEIVAKAVDMAGNVQPENVDAIWNLRGILNTSWHRVQVRIGHSNL